MIEQTVLTNRAALAAQLLELERLLQDMRAGKFLAPDETEPADDPHPEG